MCSILPLQVSRFTATSDLTYAGLPFNHQHGVPPRTWKNNQDWSEVNLTYILTGTLGRSPARHKAISTHGGTGCGQCHGLHVLIDLRRLLQLDQHDVIVNGVAVIVWVRNDQLSRDLLLGALAVTHLVVAQNQSQLTGTVAGSQCKFTYMALFTIIDKNEVLVES